MNKQPDTNTSIPASDPALDESWIALLRDLSRSINLATYDIDEALLKLMNHLVAESAIDAVALWIPEKDSPFISIRTSLNLSERYVRYFNNTDKIRIGQGIVGKVIASKKTHEISRIQEYDRYGTKRWEEVVVEEGVHSIIAAPMFVGESIVGSFNVYYKSDHEYTTEEKLFVETLANHIAVILKNFENYQSIETDREKLSAHINQLVSIQDVVQQINLHIVRSVTESLAFLHQYLELYFKCKAVQVYLFNDEDETLSHLASYKVSDAFIETSRLTPPVPAENALVAKALTGNNPVFSERVFTDEGLSKQFRTLLSQDGNVALALVPLTVQDRVVGLLAVYYGHVHSFSEEEESVLSTLSQFIAISIENNKIFQSLTEEKQKTSSIVYSLHDGLIVFDLDGTIIEVNPKCEEIFDLKKDELIGKNPSLIKSKDPRYINLKHVADVYIDEHKFKEIELHDPNHYMLKVSQVPLVTDHVKIGSVIIIRDITREHAVEKLKTSFVSTASHQLRTPLTGIRWGLEELTNSTDLSDKQVGLVQRIANNVNGIIDLINGLLDVSRIEEGKLIYSFSLYDPEKVIAEMLDSVRINADKNDISVEFKKLKKEIPTVCGDKDRIAIALKNLIDNAVKYSPEGETVTITLDADETNIHFEVIDNGIGIPEKSKRSLFNKFFRAENAIRKITEGSGLGLFIVKSVVEKHGGTITVNSTAGKGTTFHVSFPIEQEIVNRDTLTD